MQSGTQIDNKNLWRNLRQDLHEIFIVHSPVNEERPTSKHTSQAHVFRRNDAVQAQRFLSGE